MDKNGIIGSSSGTHDASLVNVLNVTSLHGEPVNNDREVGDASSVLFEALWTFDGIPILVGVDTASELFDHGPRTSSYGLDADQVVGLLFGES